jgi:hypothetical protein
MLNLIVSVIVIIAVAFAGLKLFVPMYEDYTYNKRVEAYNKNSIRRMEEKYGYNAVHGIEEKAELTKGSAEEIVMNYDNYVEDYVVIGNIANYKAGKEACFIYSRKSLAKKEADKLATIKMLQGAKSADFKANREYALDLLVFLNRQ